MKVLLAHPGTQYSHQLAYQLEKAGLLYRFYTSFAIADTSFTGRLLKAAPAFIFNKISNRITEGIPKQKIRSFPFLDMHTINSKKNVLTQEEMLYKRNQRFQESIPDSAIKESDVVIGFDTSSWLLAERCKKFKKLFILDVSIGHPVSKEKIYKKLAEDYPGWKEQINPKKKLFLEWESKEMQLADVVMVPGAFVKQTLEENAVAAGKIKVNQFGTNTALFNFDISEKVSTKNTRFLFLGAFTARKGLPFLLDAWAEKKYTNAELIIAGYGKIPEGITLPPNVINKGIIAKDDRQALFYNADVFLFPSFFEGLAQVQIEAMSAGLPVVGTKNSGASDLVDDGVNGFIIEAGNKAELQRSMDYFINQPSRAREMGVSAREKAAGFTWDNYGLRWRKILSELSR